MVTGLVIAVASVVTFALYYRIVLSLDPGAAVASSFQVFGTVGHPVNDSGHGSYYYLVALQIALDFVFIAILLASFVGQAANAGPDQSSK